jgi:hypothetical protein
MLSGNCERGLNRPSWSKIFRVVSPPSIACPSASAESFGLQTNGSAALFRLKTPPCSPLLFQLFLSAELNPQFGMFLLASDAKTIHP